MSFCFIGYTCAIRGTRTTRDAKGLRPPSDGLQAARVTVQLKALPACSLAACGSCLLYRLALSALPRPLVYGLVTHYPRYLCLFPLFRTLFALSLQKVVFIPLKRGLSIVPCQRNALKSWNFVLFILIWKSHLIRFFFVQLELNRYLCARSLEELRALCVCAAPANGNLQGLFIANLQKNTVIIRGFYCISFPYFLQYKGTTFF